MAPTLAFQEPSVLHSSVYPARVATLEPLVLLPGLLCDQALWRYQINALADIAAPMVADLTLDNSIEAMARRTLAAAPRRFSLAGLSMGGYVALEIMRQAPERVKKLALIDTSARLDSPARTAQREAGIASLRHGTFVGITHKLLHDLLHADHIDGPVATEMRTMATRIGGAAFLRQQEAIMRRPDPKPTLATIDVATMIVVGEDDRVTPLDQAEDLHRQIAGSTFHRIRKCGHMPALERPEETAFLLRGWLSS